MIREWARKLLVTDEIHERVDSMPHPVGEFGWDPWGYHRESSKLALSVCKWLYDNYFRVEAHGLQHVPATGRALVVANHSGQLPMDGVMIGTAISTSPHGSRAPRAMIERFFPTVPFLGNMLNSWGAVIGDPLNCAKLLDRDEVIIVFPEGVRGSGKLYDKRYQLQRFGNGFMHLAITHRAPIIPVGVVGCEETMPAVHNFEGLARMLGVPYIPLAPPLPLPARVVLNFGKPMDFTQTEVHNEKDVTACVEEVKEEIRRLIQKGLKERKEVF